MSRVLDKVGVLDLQGDVSEHVEALRRAASEREMKLEVVRAKFPKDLEDLGALVLTGGESTVVARLAEKNGLLERLVSFCSEKPVLGTCAGLVFLAKEVSDRALGVTGQKTLGVLDVTVVRNAFGRQAESFEADLTVSEIGGGPFPGVFIRAPVVERVGRGVEVLSKYGGKVVMVRQGKVLATSFHPELTLDSRIHGLLLESAFSK